ncbi:TPA: alanyl-tRNA editing protein [Methanosarcina acetivorans]|uniref:Alanyl-tRNA editing protein AlaX-M n=2 Tax=Methanosarcina acetivorans TaxID=2214 RepID=ALAXM_METAC|nr:alanyl-tRNA editing protein AlaXM [Methanosarcina acetivorans]Q8TPA0.1 RecName: Full=Alanyl-tRNA editing protein AlaX-M; Short=AlaX-M; AltName: Full=Alanyl-tRNA deacylase AlaX-M [Methanosarcina acetivorans C2A]AAM05417.1 alanyl-tRNA synthetase domain protein [Methanosarcina acetivorans C2A]HIH95788.1 alanyl-tRNA editing protein [Methanosarcina acetivorans]
MTEVLYFLDCYLREFEAIVEKVTDDKYVVLDRTAFYPESGGQPSDTGKLVREEDGAEFEVVYVGKFNGDISHEITPVDGNAALGLKAGDRVRGIIDWDRRYRHMRMHTATHVIANVIEKEAGAQITGNQLGLDKSRVDFSLEAFDRDKFAEYEKIANKVITENHPVNLYLVSRKEAEEKLSRLTTLAKGFSEEISEVRLVEIEGITIEACGGTHLKNTGEIKGIKIEKLQNKGKSNRRMYFTLLD